MIQEGGNVEVDDAGRWEGGSGGLTPRGKGRAGTPRPQGRGDRTPPAPQWGGTGEKGDREKLQVPPADPQRAGRRGTAPAGCPTEARNVLSRAEPNRALRAEPVHPPRATAPARAKTPFLAISRLQTLLISVRHRLRSAVPGDGAAGTAR